MFGRLTEHAFIHGPVETAGTIMMALVAFGVIGLITYLRRWKWLWHEWLTSLDPKRIGVMYTVTALLMLFKGIADAVMMRLQQAIAAGNQGYLSSEHFQQVVTAHGTTMIFFVGMGLIFGLMNLIVPLQIGARDVAFPFLNALSFWFFAVGAFLVNLSLAVGDFSAAGWVGYPPLSGKAFSPGVGVDYWIWSVQISGIGSLLSGINFLTTIIKMRCPGMTLMKMPVFIWAIVGSLVLIVFAFPILTATLAMLSLDRLFDMHFFTPNFGGNPMMYVNLIWAWGHPEVYILVLPAFGVFSEVVPTFSEKRLFGYTSMVWALAAITFLSFIVWLHHFFTMGAGANVNAFFGIMTMIIAVPTGVKIFNWLFTMYRGRVHFTTPLLWFLGFLIMFTIGGMAGVMMSIPAVDFQVHNSLFLIAHFHSVIIGGVLFGFLSALAYWFPKFTGFKLNEPLGKYAFWFWIIGFVVAFLPLYVLGFMGATRRLDHYDVSTGWQPLFIIAGIGVLTLFIGANIQVAQIIVSVLQRKKNQDTTGDPWNGRMLEWATPSPPPIYNFAIIPEAHDRDAFWFIKHSPPQGPPQYTDIHMPKNSPMAIIAGGFAFLFGFGTIWQISWLAIFGIVCLLTTVIIRLIDEDTEYCITKEEVAEIEQKARSQYT